MEFLNQGGFFIYAIAAIGFGVTVLVLERTLTLFVRFRTNGKKLFRSVRSRMLEGRWTEIEEILESQKNQPLAQILRAGIAKRKGSLDEIQLALEAEASYQLPRIHRRMSALTSLANLSTLTGLVGTVVGLIKSFGALGGTMTAAGVNKGQALAAGVSESMIATAGGLIIAIPAILAHLILSGRAQRLIEEVDHFALELKKLLSSPEVRQANAAVAIQFEKITKEGVVADIVTPSAFSKPTRKVDDFSEGTNAAKKLAIAAEEVINEATERSPTGSQPRPESLVVNSVNLEDELTQRAKVEGSK